MKKIACFILSVLVASVVSLSAYGDVAVATAKTVTNTAAWGRTLHDNWSPNRASDGSTTNQWCTLYVKEGQPYYDQKGVLPVQMIFDLGTDQAISQLQFWNYQHTGNDIKDFTLRVSSSSAGLTGLSDSKTLKLTAAQLDNTYLQNFNIGALTDDIINAGGGVRYIELTVNSNYGGERVGVADVKFVVGKSMPNSVTGVDDKTGNPSGNPLTLLIDGKSNTQWYTVERDKNYFSGLPATEYPKLTFDMGLPQTLSGITLNNYSVQGNRMKDFTLDFYDAAGNQIVDGTGAVVTWTGQAESQDFDTLQTFDFGQDIAGVRSVRMTINSNWVELGTGGDRVGFSEIAVKPVGPTLSTEAAAAQIIAKPVEFLKVDTITPVAVKDYHDVTQSGLANLIDGNKATEWYTFDNNPDYYTKYNAPVLTFDLGGTHALSGLSLWGYGRNANQMRDFRLNFLDAAGNFLTNEDGSWLEEAFVLLYDAGAKTEQEFGFEAPIEAAYVMLTALDNYYGYGVAAGGDRVGFAEIAFHTLPEPATAWLLLISVISSSIIVGKKRFWKK